MNKTKKRACKRANRGNTIKTFWKGYYALDTRIKRVKYVRACMGLCLSEAMAFTDRHSLDTSMMRPQPSRPSWNDAPLVPNTDDILF